MKISSDVAAIEYLTKAFEENPSWGPAVGASPIHRSSLRQPMHSAPSFSGREREDQISQIMIGQSDIVRNDDF